MKLLLCRVASLAFSVVSTLTTTGTALAQDTPMAAAAAQIASAIAASKQTTAMAFDFSGPEGRVTVLGQQLASDFNAALEKSVTWIHVEDRSLMTYQEFVEQLENIHSPRGEQSDNRERN